VFDQNGNLYICDRLNGVIRKVGPNGQISAVAGGGANYPGNGGFATDAELRGPQAVAVDAYGQIFVADTLNHRVVKVGLDGILVTVAGNGVAGFSGDGDLATEASLNNPEGVLVDGSGNVYIADSGNNRVRRVDVYGNIATLAGAGVEVGDGGPAAKAQLWLPSGLAMDKFGALYIADTDANRVRRIDQAGVITTVAGDIYTYPSTAGYGGDGGPANIANLNNPTGVAVDLEGNVFIADSGNDVVRLVGVNGIISTFAGNGTGGYAGDGGAATNAELNAPWAVALDLSGNVFVADQQNQRIRQVLSAESPSLSLPGVTPNNAGSYAVIVRSPYGSVTSAVATLTVVMGPTLTSYPQGASVIAGENAHFAAEATGTPPFSFQWQFNGAVLPGQTNSTLDLIGVRTNSAGVYSVVVSNLYGRVQSPGAGLSVGATPSILSQPVAQAALLGGIATEYVAAGGGGPYTYEWRLNGLDLPAIIDTVAGNGSAGYVGDGGVATNAELDVPNGVVFDSNGNLYIADQDNNVIRKLGPDGLIRTVAGGGTAYPGDGGPATNAQLAAPQGVAVDAYGGLLIADTSHHRVARVDPNGTITTVAGNGVAGFAGDGGAATNAALNLPGAVLADNEGNIFIADTRNNRVRKVDLHGMISTVAGGGSSGGDGGPGTVAVLAMPSGLAMDGQGALYIADTGDNRVRRLEQDGVISTVAGDLSAFPSPAGYGGDGGFATRAGLNAPSGVATDGTGNLFIADSGNNLIRRVDTGGLIVTVAGNGTGGFAGDDGAATNASVNVPWSIALDHPGNLFVADQGNQRVREVFLGGSAGRNPPYS
jgi:sugar lactone lactonase YvrE